MTGIAYKTPLTCPRSECVGSVYAEIVRELGDVVRYKVMKVDAACTSRHILTNREWDDAKDEAREIAKVWTKEHRKAPRESAV